MGTTAEKLEYLIDTKEQIRTAIVDKGVSCPVGTPFRDYASKIASIQTGGGSGETVIDNWETRAKEAGVIDSTGCIANGTFTYAIRTTRSNEMVCLPGLNNDGDPITVLWSTSESMPSTLETTPYTPAFLRLSTVVIPNSGTHIIRIPTSYTFSAPNSYVVGFRAHALKNIIKAYISEEDIANATSACNAFRYNCLTLDLIDFFGNSTTSDVNKNSYKTFPVNWLKGTSVNILRFNNRTTSIAKCDDTIGGAYHSNFHIGKVIIPTSYVPTLQANAFGAIPPTSNMTTASFNYCGLITPNFRIYVNIDLVASFKAATNWAYYADYIEGIPM